MYPVNPATTAIATTTWLHYCTPRRLGNTTNTTNNTNTTTNNTNTNTPRARMPRSNTVGASTKIYYYDTPFWRAEISRMALHIGNVSCVQL